MKFYFVMLSLMMVSSITSDAANAIRASNRYLIKNELNCHGSDSLRYSFDSLLNLMIDSNELRKQHMDLSKLFVNEHFNYVYKWSSKYYHNIKSVIGSGEYTRNQKIACVFLMQGYDFDAYFDVSKYCLSLFNRGVVDEEIIYFMIIPEEWRTDMRYAERYKDPLVKEFLKNVIRNKKLSERHRNAIRSVYSGKMLKDRNKMIKEGWEP